MNRQKAIRIADELMRQFSTVIIEEDFDAETEDSWDVSVADSSFFNDAISQIMAFAKKNKLCFVIKTNTVRFFEDDSEIDEAKETGEAKPQ